MSVPGIAPAGGNSSGLNETGDSAGDAVPSRCRSPITSLDRLGLLEERVHLEGAAKIGSGNLGVVLLAQDRKVPSRSLAVKILSLQLVRDTGHDEERIWQEVQVMRDLERHPHLVRLVDVLACWNRLPFVQSDPPHVCLVTEYVSDSEPLSSFLRRLGPSVQLASHALPQLADALAMLHNKGVVHRDVWCENVLICERTGHTVLVDFGCAEYLHSDAPINTKLNIPYMSPEAARGQRQGAGDDCWALGLVLTEMLTGRFVADRLGRSDWPIHYSPHVLAEARQDAALRGGPWLGELCGQLLEVDEVRRLSMAELSARWKSEAGRLVYAVRQSPPVGGGRASMQWRPVAWQGSQQMLVQPCAQPPPPPRGYPPAQLRVVRKKAASALVPPGTPLLGAAPPVRMENGASGIVAASGDCDTTAPLCSGPGVSAVLPPAQRPRPPNGLLVRAAPNGRVVPVAGPPTVVVPVLNSGASIARLQSETSNGVYTGGSLVKSAGAGAELPPLSVGLRITYLARSNGQRYLGYIMRRLSNGWHVVLDVGEKKDVEDDNVWRIQPVAAAA